MNTQTLLEITSHKRATSWRKLARALVLVPLTAFVATGAVGRSEADQASLAGSWSGGGWVSFASGTKEKARCRASYSRVSSSSYSVQRDVRHELGQGLAVCDGAPGLRQPLPRQLLQ